MAETITVTPTGGGYDSDGNPIDAGAPVTVSTLGIAPGNTTLSAIQGGDTEQADFTVYLPLGAPVSDDDEVTVRGRLCRARVKEWVSPWTGRGGLEVLCKSATGGGDG